jgi:hypothetical protein
MGVFNKEKELPDELKDLGLTPAQIREAIQAKKDLETKLAAQSTELSTVKTSLGQLEGTFNQTKAKLEELEANTNRRQNNEDGKNKKTYTSFIDDEDAAFAERAADAMQPVAMVAMRSAANSARLAAKLGLQGQSIDTPGGKIPLSRLWDKWESEIDKQAETIQLAVLGNPTTWRNVLDYVIGKHMTDLMKEPQTFVESAATNQDRRIEGDKKDEKLNDSENDVIKKMSRYGKGVTPEAYKKTKDGMTFVGV